MFDFVAGLDKRISFKTSEVLRLRLANIFAILHSTRSSDLNICVGAKYPPLVISRQVTKILPTVPELMFCEYESLHLGQKSAGVGESNVVRRRGHGNAESGRLARLAQA